MEPVQFILPFLWALIISLYAVPSVVELAWEKGLMDSFEKRKVHNLLTPRLGGVAIFAGVFSGILIFGEIDRFNQYFLAGILLIFFIGVRDDLHEIKPWKKLIVQLLATFIVFYEGEFMVTSLSGFLGIEEISPYIFYFIGIIMVLTITNSINFIDGLDGLAGIVSMIPAILLGVFFSTQDYNMAVISLCLAGSLLGFLRYNLKQSSVFMGDSGSMVVGFVLAILFLKQIEIRGEDFGWVYLYSLLFVPLTDIVRVVFSRILRLQSPFKAARDHVHHILLDSGMSQKKVLILLTLVVSFVIAVTFIFHKLIELDTKLITFGLITFSIIFSVYCELSFRKIPHS